MENKKEEFYNAWYFIAEHPKFCASFNGMLFETFPYGLEIEVVKVNPETKSIDDDKTKNTLLQVWLEYGPYDKVELPGEEPVHQPTHDYELDCGGDDFESAIIELAKLIKEKYGDYESQTKKTRQKTMAKVSKPDEVS